MSSSKGAKVYVAALTPMNQDLSVDYDLLISHCHSLLQKGGHGLAILGTTGEANSFSVSERKTILEKLMSNNIASSSIMLGTGCCSLTDTIELTQHGLDLGITKFLMMPPFYYKSLSDDGLYQYFRTVVLRLNFDSLQIYLYHFPALSGIPLSHSLIKKLIDDFPGIFVGIKDSSGDLEHMKKLCRTFPQFQIFAGTEKYLLPVLQAGGEGCISATANITIEECARLANQWQQESAESLQEEVTRKRTLFEGNPFSAVLKQTLAKRDHQPQWLHLRPPLDRLADNIIEEILEKYNEND